MTDAVHRTRCTYSSFLTDLRCKWYNRHEGLFVLMFLTHQTHTRTDRR